MAFYLNETFPSTLKQKKSEVHTLENDLKEIRATQSNDETDRAGMEAELIAEEEKLAEFESKYKKAMSERNEAQNERKELQRKDNEVDNSLASCEEEVKEGEFKGVELNFMGLDSLNLHNMLHRGFLKPWEKYTGAKINWWIGRFSWF